MKFLKLAVPAVLVLCVAWAITSVLKATKSAAKKRAQPSRAPSVEIQQAQPGNYQISIATRGEVRARTRSVLVPEVPGRITWVAGNFRDGGFFKKDDMLVEIDPRDYENAVVVAAGNLAEAMNAHEQEKARAEQARENWERLGNGKQPTDLVLRGPQLREAEARVKAAAAQLKQAEDDLERTKIVAPYNGRILEQLADVGQFVTTGTSLARVFATDELEVRLPLSDKQAAFVNLPEDFRGEVAPADDASLPDVSLTKAQWQPGHRWTGKVVRVESSIDPSSRQLFVVAQVDDPYRKREDGTPPLKIGDFVEAEITGKELTGVYTVPRTAIREGDQAWLVDGEQRLRVRDIEIVWGDAENVIVAAGLSPGDTLCTKPPAFATDGAKVNPLTGEVGEDSSPKRPQPPGKP